MPTSLPFLPDSRARVARNVVSILTPFGRLNHVPCYCANCGKQGPWVTEEHCTFAFYLCDPCASKFGQIDGMYMVPDEAFFAKVREAQLEKYGRELNEMELIHELEDPETALSKLVRDFARRN